MAALAGSPALDLPQWLRQPDPALTGALVFVLVVVVTFVVRHALIRTLGRGDADRMVGRQVGRFVGLLIFVLGTIYALSLGGVKVAPLLGALGVGGIAVAFAAQDILQNLVAGLLIQLRRPFRIGDQITSLGFDGTVLDVDLRAVRLLTFDGLDVVLPNAAVLGAPITNHTKTPMRRTTLEVGVAYDTDLDAARQIILEAVGGLPGVEAEPPPTVWVEEFADSAITIAVMFWHRSQIAVRWRVRNDVAIAVKRRLDEAAIEIAFPQRTVWLRHQD